MQRLLENCRLCPRECGVNRVRGEKGRCGEADLPSIARAALHMWEEPCISGERGSGAVFFSGCALRCIYCQNHEIAFGERGKKVTPDELSDIFLKLQAKGAHNINLVTASHFVPHVREALLSARSSGMKIPVIYNCGGYEKKESLRQLEGLIDIFMPDFKYMDKKLAEELSGAPDYPEVAKEALEEMVGQTGEAVFGADGMLVKGTLVRNLLLPGHLDNSKKVVEYLVNTYGNRIYISLMNQFTPVRRIEKYPELNRRVTKREYGKLLQFAIDAGVENGFIQEGDTAKESFIPNFNDLTEI